MASTAANADTRSPAVRISVIAPAWSCAAGTVRSVLADGSRAAAALRGLPGRGIQLGLHGVPALVAVLAPEGGAVGQDGVDLPPLATGGAGDPELVLPGVAAGRVALVYGGQARLGEPGLLGVDRVGVGDFHAEVGQGAALPGGLQHGELGR